MMSDSTIARTAVPVTPHGPDPTSALGLFSNGEFEISVAPHPVDGFRAQASGIARALGFRDAIAMTRSVPAGEKGYTLERTPAGGDGVIYLTEAGFYRALGQRQASRIKDAEIRSQVERFQSWVYGSVLPGLRKGDIVPVQRPAAELDRRALAMMVIEAEDARAAAETKVLELEPAASAWNELAAAKGSLSVAEAAKLLSNNGTPIGRKRLFELLNRMGWIYRGHGDHAWHAMQSSIETGRLAEKPMTHTHPKTGETILDPPQVRVTIKGVEHLHKSLGGEAPLDLGGEV